MKALSYLNKYFLKYKWRFLLGIIFTVASNYFSVLKPIYFSGFVGDIINLKHIQEVDNVFVISLQAGGIYMLLALISGFFLFLMRQTIIIMSRLIEYDLKNEVYEQYQKLDLSFYKKHSTGDLMNRIDSDVSQVRMYLGPGIMYSINLIVLSILAISQMVSISGTLTCYVLIPLPIMSILIYRVSSKMSKMSTSVQKEQSKISTLVQETFSGIRVVKAYSREKEIHDKFNVSAENYKQKSMKLVLINALFMPTIIFLIGLSTILSIYLGGLMTYGKVPDIEPQDILSFILFVNMLTWPFASIGWVTSIIQRAGASQARINEFLKIKPEITNPTNETLVFKGKIQFENVSFTYPNSGIKAIDNLSFELEGGQTMAIIGKTGSGKSTILSLLMRQYDPDSGRILIDGKDLKLINLDEFRTQCGIVPQDVFLFSDTIGNNIRFGSLNPNITEEEIVESTKQSHVFHNIDAFPDKFDTILGERGVNLSGGQKQRVSISRALIRNPKLLLLDDCLSAVDTETEEVILSNLKKNKKNRTTLIVSHRISSLRNADKITVIELGQKVEEGTHESLMALNGIYHDIYMTQLAEELN